MNLLRTISIFITALYFILGSSPVFGQEKESADIHKTRSSATINGQKYYLHTVEKGQTLFAIAKFYNRDINDIVIDNPEAIDGIKPGQILKILINKKKVNEISAIDTTNFILHKVEKGQTLYSIGRQHSTSIDKLKVLNPELKDGLKVGQCLKIPSFKKTDPAVNTVSSNPIVNATSTAVGIVDTVAADRNSLGYNNYQGEKKDEYNIAFFLPFHADEANAMDVEKIIKGDQQFSNKTNVALQFYEGALLAIDSLKKLHLNAKIFVYDIDDKDSAVMANVLKKPELASMDLMIGPLYGSGFVPVANYAKEHNIAIVSPFTQVNKILFNNPYVSKVSASVTLQVEQMAHFVVDSFKTQNIILVNNGNAKEVTFFNAFRNTANADLLKAGVSPADSVRIAFGSGNTQSMLSTTKVNVIILPSNNQSYVTEFISNLNGLKDRYKIVLFGLQNWINYDNLDFEYLNNLSLHIPSNTFIDYHDLSTQSFIKNYRAHYRTEPELFSFQGFDVTYCFISMLQSNGSGFLKDLANTNYKGMGSQYSFSQFPADSGFENKFVYILKYQDYQLIKAN
ncbi:MAG: LysM peptidoglycan-binding domain-containing protein [Bacteroidetes bacterium]|nr:LysM peptidoglycan-binding domain-containing protein [Bacteroidota bacterium]